MTLYDDLKYIEITEKKLQKIDPSYDLGVLGLQEKVVQRYAKNPVLRDAVCGQQGVEAALLELAKVNKGIKRFLPRKWNTEHNVRLSHLGELVDSPSQLLSRGLHVRDNFIMGAVQGAGTMFVVTYGLFKFIYGADAAMDDVAGSQMLVPLNTTVGGLVYGNLSQKKRSGELPLAQAQYLDKKIEQLFSE